MTEINPISKMFGKKPRQCTVSTVYDMVIGNTFFIKRFPNMVNAIRSTVQYTGYSWASFNSFVLLNQSSPTNTYFSKHSVYTLENFVNQCHNMERNIMNTWPLAGTH